jgi:hypothetical protein
MDCDTASVSGSYPGGRTDWYRDAGDSVRMGALRSDSSRNERAKEDLRWREMAHHGLREKV